MIMKKNTTESNTLAPKEVDQTQEMSTEITIMSQSLPPLEEISWHTDPQPSSEYKLPMEIFKDAINKKGLEGLKKQLLKSWSLYLTNTGGQMEFQELLPLLNCIWSFFLFHYISTSQRPSSAFFRYI